MDSQNEINNAKDAIYTSGSKRYKYIAKIGEGSGGFVSKVERIEDKKILAIKFIKFNNPQEVKILEDFQKEKNLNKFLLYSEEIFCFQNFTCIVTPFYENGSLRNQINEKITKQETFSEKTVFKLIKDIIIGLDYLHGKQIIHRDIKPENILIDDDQNIKIGDFGISRILDTMTDSLSYLGTPGYMSPEILLKNKYTYKTDIWSSGCVLFELLFLVKFSGLDSEFKKEISEKFKYLLSKMLTKYLERRSNASDLKNMFNTLENMNSIKNISYKDFDIYNNPYILLHNLPNRNDNFVGKNDDIKRINDMFDQNKRIVSIYSDSGNGKSSLALEYGYRFFANDEENKHAYWLKSKSDSLSIELKILADKLGVEVEKQNLEELITEIKDRLFYQHKKILFIFDNCDDLDYVKSFIELLNEQNNIFILITTNIKSINKISHLNEIEINGFNKEESEKYLKARINSITDKDVNDLIIIFKLNLKESTSPLVLNSIIGYINYKTKSILKVARVLEKLRNDSKEIIQIENDQENLTIDLILKNNRINKNILKLTALLDPYFIPIDFYTEVFKIKEQELADCFEVMEKLEIMKIEYKNDFVGLQIHNKIHNLFKKNNQFKYTEDEINNIIESLNNYLKISNNSLKEKEKVEKTIFYIQIIKLIKNDELIKRNKIDLAINFADVICDEIWFLDKCIEDYENMIRVYEQNDVEKEALANMVNLIGKMFYSLNNYEASLNYLKKCLSIQRKIYPNDDSLDIAKSFNNFGNVYDSLRRYEDALKNFDISLSIRRKIYPNDDNIDIARSLNNIGNVYDSLGKYEDALQNYEKCLSIQRKVYPNDDNLDIATSLNNIGFVYKNLGKYEDSLNNFKMSLNLRRKLYPNDDNLEIAASLSNIGKVYYCSAKYDDAINNYEKSLEIRRRIYPSDDNLDIAENLDCIGSVYTCLGKYGDALQNFEKSINIRRKIYPNDDNLDIAESLDYIGNVYRNLGKYEDALQNFKISLNIRRKIYPNDDNLDISISFNNFANVYVNLRKYEDALNNYEKSLEIRRRIYPNDDYLDIAESLDYIGSVYKNLRKNEDALKNYEKSLSIKRKIYQTDDNIDIIESLNNIAKVYDYNV